MYRGLIHVPRCDLSWRMFRVHLRRLKSLPDSQVGKPDGDSEPSLQWVDFCGIIVLQFVSHPPSVYGILFYCDFSPPTVSLQLFLFLWMWGIFFGEFQCLPFNDCSAVSCDSGALTRGSEHRSFYSAILNQSRLLHLKQYTSASYSCNSGKI